MNDAMSRRTFLSGTLGTAAAVAGPVIRAGAAAPPSERLRIAVIGCGNRGRQLIPVFRKFADVEIAVVCDVNGQSLDRAHAMLEKKSDRQRDYRKILDRKDIDAVVIATTEH